MPQRFIAALLILAIVAAPPAMAAAGGTVTNVPPSVQSFTGDLSSSSNTAPVIEHFALIVRDANGEADMDGVRILSTYTAFGSGSGTAEWTFASGTAGCPASAPPTGWTCTDATPQDGVLSFQYTFTWPTGVPVGSYTQTGAAQDAAGYGAGSTETTTFTTPPVVFNTNVYRWDGTQDTVNWGGWTATPGAANVLSGNFLKAENQGSNPATISIKFTCADFSGPSGGRIPIASATSGTPGPSCTATNSGNPNNMKFCWFQSSLNQVPESGDVGHTYSNFASCQSPASPAATVSVNIPPFSRVWVDYVILQMPAVLPGGTYGASYSAT